MKFSEITTGSDWPSSNRAEHSTVWVCSPDMPGSRITSARTELTPDASVCSELRKASLSSR